MALVVASSTLSWLSSLTLVLGALLVGDAINGAIVTSQYPVTAPAAVLRLLLGTALIWLGARVRTPPEYLPSESTEGESVSKAPEPEAEDCDFDPELSPLGGEEPTNDRRRDAAGPKADDAESGVAGSPSDTSGDGDTNGSASTGGDAGNSSAGRRGPQGGN